MNTKQQIILNALANSTTGELPYVELRALTKAQGLDVHDSVVYTRRMCDTGLLSRRAIVKNVDDGRMDDWAITITDAGRTALANPSA